MIQKQLILLLHSRQCESLKELASFFDEQHNCSVPDCDQMALIHNHCDECWNLDCSAPLCQSSKGILKHWDNCKQASCPWCAPLLKIVFSPNGLTEMTNYFFKLGNVKS